MSEPIDQRFMDAESFLMGSGGAPSAFNKNDGVGTERGGVVKSWTMQQQLHPKSNSPESLKPKFWNDGNPMMQLVVTVETTLRDPAIEDDDGTRRFFVKGDMQKALAAELNRQGLKFIERESFLSFKRTSKDPDQGVMSGAWHHSCGYAPPAQQFLATDQPAAQSPAAAVQPAQVAPDATAQAQANLAAAGVAATPVTAPASPAAPVAAVPPTQATPAAVAAQQAISPGLAAKIAHLSEQQKQGILNLAPEQRAAIGFGD